MERNVSIIRNITPGSAQWTTLVQIIDQTKELKGKLEFGQVPNKRVTITDAEGTKVIAIIRGQDIQYFEVLIQPYRRYYISNAIVSSSSDIEKYPNYPFSWLITNKTVVEPYVETIPLSFTCTFEITKFKDLFFFTETNNVQSVQGVVIAVLPPKRRRNNALSSRDFVIVNEEKRPMLMTLWKEFEDVEGVALLNQIATRPAVLAMRMKVYSFNGLQLGTWFTSSISINPPKVDIGPLVQWCNSNIDELNEMVANDAHKNIRTLLPSPGEEDVNKICEGIHLRENNVRVIWIKGTLSLLPGQTKFWYTACAHCNKAVEAENSWNFSCTACNMRTTVEIRCKIGLLLNDITGTISTMSFGQEAEVIIHFSPIELHQAYTNGISLTDEIGQHLQGKTFYCFMRHYNYNFQGHDQRRHTIVVAYREEEVTAQKRPEIITVGHEKPSHTSISQVPTTPLFTPKASQLLSNLPKTLHRKPDSTGKAKIKKALNFSDTESDSSEKSSNEGAEKSNIEEILDASETISEKK